MNVSLTPELERLIDEKVETGSYQTASEVVREALRLLKNRDEGLVQLRADIQAGMDQIVRGTSRAYDSVGLSKLAARVKVHGQRRLKGQKASKARTRTAR